ncbi:MAG: hypothetical protein ACRDQ1_12595, partial [Sciscionella sp.]
MILAERHRRRDRRHRPARYGGYGSRAVAMVVLCSAVLIIGLRARGSGALSHAAPFGHPSITLEVVMGAVLALAAATLTLLVLQALRDRLRRREEQPLVRTVMRVRPAEKWLAALIVVVVVAGAVLLGRLPATLVGSGATAIRQRPPRAPAVA